MRILLADDHTLVRAGIRSLVLEIPGVSIVAEADDGRAAVALAKQHRPDLAILDISMKELNGIEATLQIANECPDTRVLILSMHATEDFVRRALRAGAAGYLVKDSAPLELRMAIEAIMRGEVFVTSRVSRHLVSGLADGSGNAHASPVEGLTARQREILQLIAEGKSTKEIAFALGVSVKTVETHRAAIMERLDIHDIAGLTLFAVRHNLISLDGSAGG
jgi:DNA-binding NarL/FixJ family response regulator